MKTKYKMIQVNEETHGLLQNYCKEHGCSMKWLVHKLISEQFSVKNILPTVDTQRIFKVK